MQTEKKILLSQNHYYISWIISTATFIDEKWCNAVDIYTNIGVPHRKPHTHMVDGDMEPAYTKFVLQTTQLMKYRTENNNNNDNIKKKGIPCIENQCLFYHSVQQHSYALIMVMMHTYIWLFIFSSTSFDSWVRIFFYFPYFFGMCVCSGRMRAQQSIVDSKKKEGKNAFIPDLSAISIWAEVALFIFHQMNSIWFSFFFSFFLLSFLPSLSSIPIYFPMRKHQTP